MFGDMEWRSMRSGTLYDWKDTVRQMCQADPSRKVVVLEVRVQRSARAEDAHTPIRSRTHTHMDVLH